MHVHFAAHRLWLVAAIQGMAFAACMTASDVIMDHDSLVHATHGAVPGGVFFAVVMGFANRRQHKRVWHVIGTLTSEQERDVQRAASSGSAPRDPELLTSAVALARAQLAEHLRFRTFTVVVFAVFAVFAASSVIVASVDSQWYLLGAAAFAAALVWTVRYPQQLRRRIASLERQARPAA
jgi:hypothetical protein